MRSSIMPASGRPYNAEAFPMPFDHCWRWFGPSDPIPLEEIRQTGATGIVTALHQVPAGEIWTKEAITARKQMIEAAGLRWVVAESLPVHEEIRRGGQGALRFMESYAVSLRNLGACDVRTVCYNFMPVLDWSRTSLAVRYTDGTITSSFQGRVMAAFDLFLLKRPGADRDYPAELREEAEQYFRSLTEAEKDRLIRTVLLGFPGSGESYTLDGLRAAIAAYRDLSAEQFRSNLITFLRAVVPAAEEAGVRLALHPDDPPWPVLGLPRVASTGEDISCLLAAVDSQANGITLCTGSLGAGRQNDVPALAERFAARINFVHLRNVVSSDQNDFLESDHLEGNVDMFSVIRTLLLEQQRRLKEGRRDHRLPMRPDHGHLLSADRTDREYYPGYSFLGRLRGLAELRGLELGIQRSLDL